MSYKGGNQLDFLHKYLIKMLILNNLVSTRIVFRKETRERLRTLRDTSNSFELPEKLFRQLYRLDVVSAKYLFIQIELILPSTCFAG